MTVGPAIEALAVSWDVTVMGACVMDLDFRCFQAVCHRGSVKWLAKVAAFEGGLDTEEEASSWDERLLYAAGKGGLADAG